MKRVIGIAGEVAWKNFRGIDDNAGLALAHGGEDLFGAGDNEIATKHEIALSRGDPDRVDMLWPCANLHMAVDRAAFLGEARHIDRPAPFAFEMRRHAQNNA